jgi:antirestriction protein ArdC
MKDTISVRWMFLKHDMRRWIEKAQMALAWKCPRWLVYWCAIRLGCHATTGQYGTTIVPEITFMDALKRWSK